MNKSLKRLPGVFKTHTYNVCMLREGTACVMHNVGLGVEPDYDVPLLHVESA